MDIDLLSKMVKEVILDRDKVVLPGLGTFVAEMVPATFSDKGFTINPPYRRLYFRQRIEEDSSLAEFYSAANQISKELAENVLADFLKELKQVLKEKKVVVFPGLGRLRATKENNFFFVPDEDLDIYPEGFGLAPISLKTHKETKEELSAAVENLKTIISSDPGPLEGSESQEDSGSHQEQEPLEEPSVGPEGPVCLPESPAGAGPAGSTRLAFWLKAAGLAIAVIVALLILYAVLSNIFPGIFDSLLYNKEQLRILEYLKAS